jgi:hypothetical protein
VRRWWPKHRDSRPQTGSGSVQVDGANYAAITVRNFFRDPDDQARIAHLERALAQREDELHDAEGRIKDLQRQRGQLEREIERSSGEVRRLDELVREKNTTISLLSTAIADKITINGDVVRLRTELVKARRPRSRHRRPVGAGMIIVLAVAGACTPPMLLARALLTPLDPPDTTIIGPPDTTITTPHSSATVGRTRVRCVRFASPVRLPRSLFVEADIASDPAQEWTEFASTGIRSHFYLRITTTHRNVLYKDIDTDVSLARLMETRTWPVWLAGQPHDDTIELALVAVDEHTHQRLTARKSPNGYTRLTKASPAESVCDTTTATWPVTAKAGG